MIQNKSIIVTGGAGFIGSHLCELLINHNNQVTIIDNFCSYYEKTLKERNIAPFKEKITLIEEDIRSNKMKTIISDIAPDYIFHQAAQAGVRYSMPVPDQFHRPGEVMDINYTGTVNILNSALESEVKKIIFASSSSIFGNTPDLPIHEESPKKPVSYYGISKLAAERACELYSEHYGLATASLRYFTVYGPRQRPDMAINMFTHNIMCEKPINVFGQGSQTRDFTFVSDAVEANICAAMSKTSGQSYNIGGGNNVTVMELIKLIETSLKRYLDKNTIINYVSWQKGDAKDTLAINTKAQTELNWKPEVDISLGIDKYVDWVINTEPQLAQK